MSKMELENIAICLLRTIEDVSYKHLRRKYLDKLIAMGAVVMTIPESPTSSKRKYILSELGQKLINK